MRQHPKAVPRGLFARSAGRNARHGLCALPATPRVWRPPMATRTRKQIDINTANAEDIERACGIDGVLAQRVIAYRDEHGPFESREDLDRVPGFTDIRTDEVLSAVELPERR